MLAASKRRSCSAREQELFDLSVGEKTLGFDFRKHRLTLVIIGLVLVIGASVAPFMSASCSTRHAVEPAGEAKGLEQLRNMTRNGVLPAEEAVTSIESAYPNSKVAGLARILR